MNMFSIDTFKEVLNHLPVKIGVAAITVMSGIPDQILRVFLLCTIFCILACMDIVTRWWACGAKLWSDLYPQSEGSLWRYIKFMRQSHRWRYFRSEIMRDKWMSKIHLRGINVYLNVSNVAMFKASSVLDPRKVSRIGFYNGEGYPLSQTFVIGTQIQF